VKLRRTTGFGDPLEAVTSRKQATLRRLAEQYLYHRKPDFDSVRFGVVRMLAGRDGLCVRHVEDAF
jgi:putative endonuclease